MNSICAYLCISMHIYASNAFAFYTVLDSRPSLLKHSKVSRQTQSPLAMLCCFSLLVQSLYSQERPRILDPGIGEVQDQGHSWTCIQPKEESAKVPERHGMLREFGGVTFSKIWSDESRNVTSKIKTTISGKTKRKRDCWLLRTHHQGTPAFPGCW